jgi:hypothetical protein
MGWFYRLKTISLFSNVKGIQRPVWHIPTYYVWAFSGSNNSSKFGQFPEPNNSTRISLLSNLRKIWNGSTIVSLSVSPQWMFCLCSVHNFFVESCGSHVFFEALDLSVKSPCLHPVFGAPFTPYPLFQWYLSAKYWNFIKSQYEMMKLSI